MKTKITVMNILYGYIIMGLLFYIGFSLGIKPVIPPYSRVLEIVSENTMLRYLLLVGMMIISAAIAISLIIARFPTKQKFFGDGSATISKESLLCYVFYLIAGVLAGFAYVNLLFLQFILA